MAPRRRKGKKKTAPVSLGTFLPPRHELRGFLIRAAVAYFLFNFALNIALATTRPLSFSSLFVMGELNSRTRAAWLLSRHTLWHDSWLDEQIIPTLIEQAAQDAGLEVALLQALVEQESGGKPHVISGVGACGLTQLMPGTARELGVRDPFDPRENLKGGARYLASMKRRFGGNVALALAAYNAGPGSVLKAGGVPPFRETQDYVRNITARYGALTGRRPVPQLRAAPPAASKSSSRGDTNAAAKSTAKGSKSAESTPAKGAAQSATSASGKGGQKTAAASIPTTAAPHTGTDKSVKATSATKEASAPQSPEKAPAASNQSVQAEPKGPADSTAKTASKSAEKAVGKKPETADGKETGTSAEKSVGKSAEKTAAKQSGKQSGTQSGKQIGTQSGTQSGKQSGKAAEKGTEKQTTASPP